MDKTKPSSMRVLMRPQSSLTPTSSSPSPNLHPSSSPPPNPPPPPSNPRLSDNNVVVVGFIGRKSHDVTQLINRILDSNVFGSGNLDKKLRVEKDGGLGEEVMKNWFKFRQISYYRDEEKGVLFLQFASAARCPAMEEEGFLESCSGFDSELEGWEFGDLQGMLFMFSVCHIIIYVQEGSHFDTQVLKKLRVLQAAKQGLAPFVRSRTAPSVTSRPHSSSSSRPYVSTTSSKNPSPGRNHGILSRNSSAISLMSSLGSYTSLFPGQCTPVTLFVFVDDFSEVPNQMPNVEDSTDSATFNQASNLSNIPRPSLPVKGSGSVVVLARPVSKSEGGFRKKLQSSLEAQIRFLIKKCRTLTGSESSHAGSRSGGVSSSAPLFSLDASKAVVLLDRSANQGGESLEFASGLVEEILNGKATSDTLLLESHSQCDKEDLQSIKEFIYRQSDILRGRGGLVTNANSGSAAGVGMVAVAAAAAAASASSGKAFTAPELPSLDIWLSSSQLLLHGILSAKRGCIDETELNQIKYRQRNSLPPQLDGTASRVADPLDFAISWLESGKGLNTKFSTLWCQRALPAAREVYLKELPACYPTSQHEAHLEKALHAFHSMVKGPAVQNFAKQLEDECTSIWKSGRQLCDAISLTGKPCMHQRHGIDGGLLLGEEVKPHSSGFVFLHACACGRSRRLRSDPFDFETANVTSSCFPDCDKLLPSLHLPEVSSVGPVQASSWSLIRVGGARYYEPSEGLLQSGFFATKKFLLKWTIFLEKQGNQNDSSVMQQGSGVSSGTDFIIDFIADASKKKDGAAPFNQDDLLSGIESKNNYSENVKVDDRKVSFGRGFPNFTLRKPFSEVVAGSAATDSEYPPLQQKRQHILDSEKGFKQSGARDRSSEKLRATNEYQGSQKVGDISSVRETSNVIRSNGYAVGDPFLRIGSNIVPVNMNAGGKIKLNTPPKHVMVYVGFEHECPHGHRFILTPDNLGETGSSYLSSQESHVPSSVDNADHKLVDPINLAKNGGHGKVHRHTNGITTAAVNKMRNLDKSKDNVARGNIYVGGLIRSKSGKEQNLASNGVSVPPNSVKGLEESLQSVSLDDGGSPFSLLNRNIPIYMNCPHCRNLKKKKDWPKIKFSSTVSQLQRIFLVTPPFPVILATCPVIQFEATCLPPSILDREQKLQFSLGCQVILPSESFLTLRLPFIYGVQLEDGSSHPLKPFEHQPELTAWISKGTALQVMSKERSHLDE